MDGDLLTPMALRVAATLQLPTHIAAGNDTAAGMAAATGAHPGALARLLAHLVTIGELERLPNGTFRHVGSRAGDDRLDIHSGLGRAELSLVHLLHSIMTGEAAFPELYGRSFWDDMAADPARTASYDAQMGADAAAWAQQLVTAYDWAALGSLIDVGGGDGTLAVALLRAHPALRVTVMERPLTAAAARSRLAGEGLTGRGEAVSGSLFDELPEDAGGYLLCAILHDWPDEEAGAILSRCAQAAGTAGRVLVVEKIGAAGTEADTGMDLRMLAYFGGRERTAGDIARLGVAAGLRSTAVHPAGSLAIVELSR